MKILLASDHYPPYIGGAHRQTRLLAQELIARGHEVNVATVWHGGLPQAEIDAGVGLYRLRQLRTWVRWTVRDSRQRHQPPFPDPVTVVELRRLIRKLRPDVIHSHGWFSYSCAAALWGLDIPLIIAGRDYGYGCATRTLLYGGSVCSGPELSKCLGCAGQFYGQVKGSVAAVGVLASRPLLRRQTRGIHTVSHFVLQIIVRDLFGGSLGQSGAPNRPPIHAQVIPSFLIDSDDTSTGSQFESNLPSEPFILYVGGLQMRKGLQELLEAYSRLEAPPPLVLLGYPGSDTPKSFPANVRVFENVPHASVMRAWERCLFGVMPSVWPDPSPGVVREGFSRGKAIIGTALGGTPEMIQDGLNGLLVPPGEPVALAEAMQALIGDKNLRERLGRAAALRSSRYHAAVVVPEFEELFRSVAAGEVSQRHPPADDTTKLENNHDG